MKIIFNLTEEGYKSFFNFHYSQYKIMKLRPYYGTLMIIMGVTYMIWIKDNVLLPLLLVTFGIYFVISKFIYIKKAMKASRTNPSFPDKVELDIDDEGITWKDKNAHGKFSWATFLGYREFDKGFLLYQQRNAFNMIPIDCLSDSERIKLSSLLKDKMKKL